MKDPYAGFTKLTLTNGLEVYHLPWNYEDEPVNWVRIAFNVHVGAEVERHKSELYGVTHFLEHTVSRNVPNWTYQQIRDFFEEPGGYVELGVTGYFSTQYSCMIPNDKQSLQTTFDIFGRMLFCTKIEQYVEEQRKVILGEFRKSWPVDKIFNISLQQDVNLYGAHWYGQHHGVLGSPASINAIQLQDLQAWYDQYYNPHNVSVVVVGGIEYVDLLRLLDRSLLACQKAGARNRLSKEIFNPVPPSNLVENICYSELTSMEVNSSAVDMRVLLPGDVSRRALGFIKSSIGEALFYSIREAHGWLYSPHVSTDDSRDVIELSISFNGIETGNVDNLVRVVQETVHSVLSDEDKFNKEKSQMLRSMNFRDFSAHDIFTNTLKDIARWGFIKTWQDCRDEIESTSFSDVDSIAEYLVPERWYHILARP